jgi:ethanolaminephosphotransferase
MLMGVIGISYFIYRLLDEMDGKQARKTGNSSPLGMLFDHGCDSWTIGFMVTMTAKALMVYDSNMVFLYILECVCLFYFGTLEEYYVGALNLRPGNLLRKRYYGWMLANICCVRSYVIH